MSAFAQHARKTVVLMPGPQRRTGQVAADKRAGKGHVLAGAIPLRGGWWAASAQTPIYVHASPCSAPSPRSTASPLKGCVTKSSTS